jgi:ribulose-phosphate 3-epimerase
VDKAILAPSILAADFTRLGEQVQEAQAAGAGLIHIDVMDGHFVPNLTMGPLVVDAVRRVTDLPLDVHLMMTDPEPLIPAFAEAGADVISVHYEACPDLYRTLNMIKRNGCRAGVAINPHTRAAALYDVLPILDEAVVMTVSPGFGGQKLIQETLGKIARLRAMAQERKMYDFPILADGGVNLETATAVTQAGADVLVVGSAVFNEKPIVDNIAALQAVLEAARND